MYLINALAFDAEWEEIYEETQVSDGTFTLASGETQSVEMMYNTEHQYLDDGSATGFIKYYAARKYAFAALLPNEGVSVKDYAGLLDTLRGAQDAEVKTAIPKFKSE
jgi:serpin B